jgi:hypothetical protein
VLHLAGLDAGLLEQALDDWRRGLAAGVRRFSEARNSTGPPRAATASNAAMRPVVPARCEAVTSMVLRLRPKRSACATMPAFWRSS